MESRGGCTGCGTASRGSGEGFWPSEHTFGTVHRRAGLGLCDKCLKDLAEWTGLEPATPGVTGRYSNQLNYHSVPGRTAFDLPASKALRRISVLLRRNAALILWWVLRGSNSRHSPCKSDHIAYKSNCYDLYSHPIRSSSIGKRCAVLRATQTMQIISQSSPTRSHGFSCR